MITWHANRIDRRPERMLPAPYFEWARATQFVYYGSDAWLPVLIELHADAPQLNCAQAFARRVLDMQRDPHAAGWAAHVRVAPFHTEEIERLRGATHFVAVLARPAFLDSLYDGEEPASSIRRFELGRALRPRTADLPPCETAFVADTVFVGAAPAVISGIIDDGMAFAHDRFLGGDRKTRIEYVFDQHLPPVPGWGVELGKRPPNTGIDALLSACSHGGLVDEDQLYRHSGHVDHAKPGHKPLAASAAHGTHVMDLACNPPGAVLPPAWPVPGTRPIIAVQLPAATVEDTSGATLRPQVYFGLLYILWRAHTIAVRCGRSALPLVVNLSYGLIAGPHDGSDLLEAAMDELIEVCNPPGSPPFRVLLPSGNNHLSRCHARFSLGAGESRTLHWRVLPDDWTESSLEIWLPDGVDVMALQFAITAPSGDSSGVFLGGSAWDVQANGSMVGKVCYYPATSNADRALVRFALAPTAWPDGGLPLAPAGLWTIEVTNSIGADPVVDVNAWIQRDDTAPGFKRRGRQSYFDDPKYRRYDGGGRALEKNDPGSGAYVEREGTLNGIATGKRPIVLGGYRRSDGAAAPYSASGPTVPPGRGQPNPYGPDAMLPSDDAPSQRGVLGAGTRSGSCVAMNGSSVAAPQASQWIAERMAAGQSSGRPAVFYQAESDEGTKTGRPDKKRGGGGRIDFPFNRQPR